MKAFRSFIAIVSLAAAPACAEPIEGHLQKAEKVTDRVHVMRQPDRLWSAVVGNVTIIEQSDGVVLVDSGGTPAEGERVAAQVRSLTDKPVKAIALTHWHNDHPLGVSAILRHWPKARIIATAATRESMVSVMGKNVGLHKADAALDEARLQRSLLRAQEYEKNAADPKLPAKERQEYAIEARYVPIRAREAFGSRIVLPTETFDQRLLIDDKAAPVELIHLGRANTDGDIVAWLPKQRVVATGDIVVAPTPYGFNSFPRDWIDVLGKLKAMDFAYLIPGHGPVQRDRKYLDMLIVTLSDVRRQVAPLAGSGLSTEQVMAKVDYSEQRRLFTAGDPWAEIWFKGYWLEPITSSAWREAKGIPIKPVG